MRVLLTTILPLLAPLVAAEAAPGGASAPAAEVPVAETPAPAVEAPAPAVTAAVAAAERKLDVAHQRLAAAQARRATAQAAIDAAQADLDRLTALLAEQEVLMAKVRAQPGGKARRDRSDPLTPQERARLGELEAELPPLQRQRRDWAATVAAGQQAAAALDEQIRSLKRDVDLRLRELDRTRAESTSLLD